MLDVHPPLILLVLRQQPELFILKMMMTIYCSKLKKALGFVILYYGGGGY